MIKLRYFISVIKKTKKGDMEFANCEVSVDKRIKSWGDIKKVENSILSHEEDSKEISVISYKFFGFTLK